MFDIEVNKNQLGHIRLLLLPNLNLNKFEE